MDQGGRKSNGQGGYIARVEKILTVVENAKVLAGFYVGEAERCVGQCTSDVTFLVESHEVLTGLSLKIGRQDEVC